MPKSKGFIYVYSVGQINKVLDKMHSTGRPDKLTLSYVKKTWVLPNAQFGAVIDLLKAMKFLSSDGTPTDLYGEYQNKNHRKSALGKGTENAYPDLFKAYPNTPSLSKHELEGYIKQQTGADDSIVQKIYGTIRRLCSLSDFNDSSPEHKKHEEQPQEHTGFNNKFGKGSGNPMIPITMNIEVVIPSDATAEKYDQIFAAIKKHLMNS